MTVISVAGMLENPCLSYRLYEEALYAMRSDEDLASQMNMSSSDAKSMLRLLSSLALTNANSLMSIGVEAIDSFSKLTPKITDVTLLFEKDEYWALLHHFMQEATEVDISVMSGGFVFFKKSKQTTCLNKMNSLLDMGREIINHSDDLRDLVKKSQEVILELDAGFIDAEHDLDMAHKAVLLLSYTARRYIKDHKEHLEPHFIETVERNIRDLEYHISNMQSSLISKTALTMSLNDIKHSVAAYNSIINKGLGSFVPAWIKIADDVQKTLKMTHNSDDDNNNHKEGLFAKFKSLQLIGKKDVKEIEDVDHKKEDKTVTA